MQETSIHCLATLVSLSVAAVMPACAKTPNAPMSEPTAQQDATKSSPAHNASASESLLLQGYNYTDHYIASFSVNGQGGGNIFESSPTSGGSGSVCCVTWRLTSKLPARIKVRWVSGYCMYSETNQYGRTRDRRRSIWTEQDAFITEAVTSKPRALEVHFYRDGRIEAAVTEGDSPPRLRLPREENRNRPGVSQEFPRCNDDPK